MAKDKVILITGASSGIGRALALALAAPETTLLLTGRNAAKLDETARLCRAKGATAETSVIPVTDRAAFEKQVLDWDNARGIDVVIANAGVSGGTSMDDAQNEAQLREIFDINLTGTFNTVNPLIPRFQTRKSGHIVLMSSMAGFRGMPNAPAYSTSKVAVRAYGDALRPLLKKDGVTVSTIFPGFIKTPMTDVNNFKMPFLMDVDKAAEIIKRGIDGKKAAIAFPWQMHAFCWLLGALPRRLGDWILSHAPQKPPR
ncbi:MAG: SDR family NAD(P)-dependent oxidoreductase [Alphaproteobacteria bacterium]|nr:SDR family NAD(P)-dependent oxidoreductase [Alphaproteobacteria bacterium]MDE2336034.1 SDR family NAD(P)-dependent oxidoreductase [Alphaproteobacteria bacterium]